MSDSANDLIHENSPYLLQHAYNPVEWHAWNPENLESAKALGKPLLISIGYSSCHWCHVMERESFEDKQVAEIMNELFYCIKVDKEERPDVDQLYMTAANIITGGGGWPLHCFAFPDGRPFHAGTYYPKEQWINLLLKVDQQFVENHARLEDYAVKLTQGIRLQETVITDQTESELKLENLQQGISKWKNRWDMAWGGSIGAPKFPMPNQLEFLMAWTDLMEDTQADDYIQLSLTKMMYGGIYDQIRGGFARYSVDGVWKVPHFEKMLYDNAQLLSIYAKASLKYERNDFRNIAEQTFDWLLAEMQGPDGLYYSAIDADSEGEEGKFYVWGIDELKDLLADDWEFTQEYYSLQDIHMWEKGRYVLMRRKTDQQIMEQFELTENKLAEKVKQIDHLLLERRNTRVKPGIDTKCLTSWNGLLLSSFCDLYRATGTNKYKEAAEQLGRKLIQHQFNVGQLYHSRNKEVSSIDGMLEDAAFLGIGLLDVFSISSDPHYFNNASALSEYALRSFYDLNKKIFYMSKKNEMIMQVVEIYDNVIPASNSAMANFLYKLGLLKADTNYLRISKEMVSKIQENVKEHLESHSNWALAQLMMSKDYYEVIVVGADAKALYTELITELKSNCILLYSEDKSELPMFKDRYSDQQTWIYLCKEGQCSAPVNSKQQLLEQLELNQNNK